MAIDAPDSMPIKMGVSEALESYYTNNVIDFRSADIFCLGSTSVGKYIDTILRLFLNFRDSDGNSPISEIVAVLPPGTLPADEHERLQLRTNKWLALNAEHLPPDADPETWFRLIVAPDLRSLSVAEIAGTALERSIVVVLEAANFRDEDIGVPIDTATAPLIAEDIWAPQLHALCVRLIATVAERQIHIVLEAGKLSPRRPEHRALLESIENAAVLGAGEDADGETFVAENLSHWEQLLADGHVGQVLGEINAYGGWPEAEKAFYRIQMLDRAGLQGQALEEIENFDVGGVPPLVLARLSRIAGNAGATLLAAGFLNASIGGLNTIDGLLMALDASDRISDQVLSNQIVAKIETLYPGHAVLKSRVLEQLRVNGEFKKLSELIEGGPSSDSAREFYRALAIAVPEIGTPSYADVRRDLDKSFPQRAIEIQSLLARDALRRKLPFHALDILSPIDLNRPTNAHLILDVIEFLVFGGAEARHVDGDALKSSVGDILRYLAEHPDDSHVRTRLVRVLSVDVTGTMGLAVVASLALDFMSRPLELTSSVLGERADIDIETVFDRFKIRKALQWLEAQGPIVLGHAVLPPELIDGSADDLAEAINRIIGYISERVSDEGDVKTLMMMLTLGLAVNPHTSRKNYDLPMIRTAAAALAAAGRVQTARDIAEQVMRTGSPTPQRKRVIWFVFADIYLRLGNTLESLIAFASAAAGDTKVDGDEAWHETNGLVRLLRSIGLFATARGIHEKGGDILRRLGLAEVNAHRQRLMSFSIDMMEAISSGGDATDTIPSLLDRAAACAEEAMSRNDSPDSAAVALAQMVAWARKEGVLVSDQTLQTLDRIHATTSAAMSDLVRALTLTDFDADALLRIHRNVESARYADDAGFDSRYTAIAAHHLLASEGALQNPIIATFSIELLADRAISRPGWKSTARPLPLIDNIAEPAATAERLSRDGMSVVLLGTDSNNQLAHVTWQEGTSFVLREAEEMFSVAQFRTWAGEYPYLYGVDDGKTPNLFYLSTEHLGLTSLPEGPVTIIADTELQQFPPNLLRVGDYFAGQIRPMSAAPSLSWLKAAHADDVHTNGKMMAWISQEDSQGATLVSIAEWLDETFDKHGIELDGSANVPEGLTGSDLVIVAAHGGLGPDDRYFQRVSDEGELSVSGRELAVALRNVGVVILFVCSGGRADKMPGAVTTVGLSKKLLDQGCSAVIASPWPLDPRVAYQWLPTFLDEWKAGGTLAEATFKANGAVERAVGFIPEKCLAMTVFGDGMLKYRSTDDREKNASGSRSPEI